MCRRVNNVNRVAEQAARAHGSLITDIKHEVTDEQGAVCAAW